MPTSVSRLWVHVELRMSTSTSPVWTAVKRSAAVSDDELDGLGVTEHGGGDRTAVLGVDALHAPSALACENATAAPETPQFRCRGPGRSRGCRRPG